MPVLSSVISNSKPVKYCFLHNIHLDSNSKLTIWYPEKAFYIICKKLGQIVLIRRGKTDWCCWTTSYLLFFFFCHTNWVFLNHNHTICTNSYIKLFSHPWVTFCSNNIYQLILKLKELTSLLIIRKCVPVSLYIQ